MGEQLTNIFKQVTQMTEQFENVHELNFWVGWHRWVNRFFGVLETKLVGILELSAIEPVRFNATDKVRERLRNKR